jgi:ABC-type amino acid transport substrate-binding protein
MMRPRLWAPVLGLALLLLPLASTAIAAENSPVLSRIVESGQLRVGMSGAQPPFNFKGKNGSLMGYDVQVARLLANAMGVELVPVEKPFGDLLGALEKGDVDVVISGMTMTPERNLRAAFIGPYMISGKSILTKSSTIASIDEAGEIDRENLKVAALRGSTSEEFVRAVAPKVQLTLADSPDAAVQMVLDDQVDALVADFPTCALAMLRHPEAGLATLEEPLTIEPIGVAVAPGDSLLLNMMENYLGALDVIGVFEELEGIWFESGAWLAQLP